MGFGQNLKMPFCCLGSAVDGYASIACKEHVQFRAAGAITGERFSAQFAGDGLIDLRSGVVRATTDGAVSI